ncbi:MULTISPECIES: DUF6440 family protein [Saccharibacillus]|uniref:DUF6440 domain-containing protein n=1 Tax=Saccharibacillus brassicae TaxID=2583377 RepID=A0A4Y6V0U3_SACBS|nr:MULTISPECIES: DUF6440 family protein [Saccharibacillus]QDH22087.1 hypothetical protein FFV09_15290 [Saccharibacillus brassicae]
MLIRPPKENRFYEKSTDYLPDLGVTKITILVDRETGVNYVYTWSVPNSSGGLTPLLDANGNVVVDEI